MQEYLALQASLADALRAGFLSLAQARYSMGPDRVSALQFPSHMRASARVRAAGAAGGRGGGGTCGAPHALVLLPVLHAAQLSTAAGWAYMG